MVTNGASLQSGLTIRDVTATISLPAGPDLLPGTADDPLRMAKGADGLYFASTMTVYNSGPDGKTGTADDISFMHPSENGQADFDRAEKVNSPLQL